MLSDRAFKLYIRMNLHQPGYGYGLSPKEIHDAVGMSEDRYRSARRELEEKGYLVPVAEKMNRYTFYEYPQKDNLQPMENDDINHADLEGTHGEGEHITSGNVRIPPVKTGGEILQYNTYRTSNNRNNVTDVTKGNSYPSYLELMKKREQEKQKEFEARCHEEYLSCLDEDERGWYSDPQSDIKAAQADEFFAGYECDDADMPF